MNDNIFSGRLLDIRHLTKILPDGRSDVWEVASYRDNLTAVGVLGFEKSTDSLILIENYRPSLGSWNLEITGGLPFIGESVEDAAVREYEEETGWVVEELHYLNTFFSLPGCGRLPIACYWAETSPAVSQKLDKNEFANIRTVDYKTLNNLIEKNIITEPITMSVLCSFYRKKFLELIVK